MWVNTEMIKVTTKFDVYDGIKTRLIFILMVIDIVVSIGSIQCIYCSYYIQWKPANCVRIKSTESFHCINRIQVSSMYQIRAEFCINYTHEPSYTVDILFGYVQYPLSNGCNCYDSSNYK